MSDFIANPAGLIFAIVASLSLSFLVAGVGLVVVDRLSLRSELRDIDDLYQLVGVRDQELMLPFVDRVSGPAQRILTRVGRRVSPGGYVERVRILMLRAGRLAPSDAVARTVANVEGEMSDEFGLALAEMRAGASRSDALKNLGERVQIPEVQSFVLAIRQADEFGISVASVLRTQAEEMRVHRRQL